MDLNIGDPEQIKQLITLLQQMLPKDNSEPSDEDNTESPIKTKSTKFGKSGHHHNKFLEMAEKDMHKGDKAIDKKLAVSPPTPRSRKFKPVDVVCRDCGKKEKVNPAILPDSAERYRCNKCSTTPGK